MRFASLLKKSMNILGIHSGGHEISACLIVDGRIAAVIAEERLTRVKNDGGRMPWLAVDRCLEMAGLERRDVDHLFMTMGFMPEHFFRRETWPKEWERRLIRLKRSLKGNREESRMMVRDLDARLAPMGRDIMEHFRLDRFRQETGLSRAEVHFVEHHQAHAVAAAYFSGWDECAAITLDGVGDREVSHTAGLFDGFDVIRKYETDAPGASLGNLYTAITQLLGFKPFRHEGKITGLAAYGDPEPLYPAMAKAAFLEEDKMRFSGAFIGRRGNHDRFVFLREALEGHEPKEAAAAVQQRLEDLVLSHVGEFMRREGQNRLALCGGVVANVKLNQHIGELPEVDEVFVFPGMSDVGNSVGAALIGLREVEPELYRRNRRRLDDVYWGPEYTPDQIEEALREAGVEYRRLDEDELVRTAAAAMHAGRVVGWFQGRMEFGPRALGNRSIIGAPTDPSINDWLNERLDRTEFMPFAPSVLEDYADELFENVDMGRYTARFMTITYNVKPEWHERIPAVVHVDGTARPQFVTPETNPLYYKVIDAYRQLSGIPLVLNTSFNAHEEPIVCAPREALQAFLDQRIDCLAAGPFWMEHKTGG